MKKLFITIFVIFSFHNSSLANEAAEFAGKTMNELDTNRKGYISKKDIETFSRKEFKAMDTNADGLVSKNEFAEYICNKNCKEGDCECKSYKNKIKIEYIAEYWNRLDIDGKGYITPQDKLSNDIDAFYGLDYNNDGKITKEEIEAQFY